MLELSVSGVSCESESYSAMTKELKPNGKRKVEVGKRIECDFSVTPLSIFVLLCG